VNIKKTLQLLLISFCSLVLIYCATQKQSTTQTFLREVKDKTLIPEGIAVHPSNGKIYLSSLHQAKIVVVNDKGAVSDVITNGKGGFMWGLGMKFSPDGKILWACSANGKGQTALFAIDHLSGKIIKQYQHDSARFLNDLVLLNDGRIFITDTEKGAVFVLQNDSLQLFLKDEQLKWANGITAIPNGNVLFVASGRYGLMKVDITTQTIASATNKKRTDYAIDGLVLHKQTLYAAIGWPQDSLHQHRIIRYHLDEQFQYKAADTMSINQPWLKAPTTLAVHNNQLYALSFTNLGIYNRHNQQVDKIMDSLRNPIVAVFPLK